MRNEGLTPIELARLIVASAAWLGRSRGASHSRGRAELSDAVDELRDTKRGWFIQPEAQATDRGKRIGLSKGTTVLQRAHQCISVDLGGDSAIQGDLDDPARVSIHHVVEQHEHPRVQRRRQVGTLML